MDFQIDYRQLKRLLVHMLLLMSMSMFSHPLPFSAGLAISEGDRLFPRKLKIPAPVVSLCKEVGGK